MNHLLINKFNFQGHVDINDELLLQYAKDFDKEEKHQKYEKSWDMCRMVKLQHDPNAPEEIVALEVSDDEDNKKKWDCESILSTYSNIYNHPKVIDMPTKRKSAAKIQINPKTGIPLNTLESEKGKLTIKSLATHENELLQSETFNAGPKSLCAESILSTLSVLSLRPKDETPEERRERKKLLKEYRNERRIEKKANKIAFNQEKLRQQINQMNIRNNVQGSIL